MHPVYFCFQNASTLQVQMGRGKGHVAAAMQTRLHALPVLDMEVHHQAARVGLFSTTGESTGQLGHAIVTKNS